VRPIERENVVGTAPSKTAASEWLLPCGSWEALRGGIRSEVTRNLLTATLGDEFAYKLTKNTSLPQNLYYVPSFNNPDYATYHVANYWVTGNFGIATKLNGWLTANMNFNDQYNSQPLLGNKKNDILFTTGLGLTFGAKPAK
jgi:hypothetical protein